VKLSIYILTTIGFLFSGTLKAQFPTNLPQTGGGFPTGNQQTGFPQSNQQDKGKQNANVRIGLDDSTSVVYGPTSTKYFLEEDVFNNRKRLYNIDTTIDGIHNYNFVQRYKNLYQDLGNIGTAIRPVFYKAPEQIGTLLGYDAFSLLQHKISFHEYYLCAKRQ
jgi:Putative porin